MVDILNVKNKSLKIPKRDNGDKEDSISEEEIDNVDEPLHNQQMDIKVKIHLHDWAPDTDKLYNKIDILETCFVIFK